MSQSTPKLLPTRDLGLTWMLSGGAVFIDADKATKLFIADESKLAHQSWQKIARILELDGVSGGGLIIERQSSTLLMGNFDTKEDELVSAEGELIQDVKPHFDYCFARM
jgi:hypothetical protein